MCNDLCSHCGRCEAPDGRELAHVAGFYWLGEWHAAGHPTPDTLGDVAALAARPEEPEVVSVLVAGDLEGYPVNVNVARAVAPLVARALYPGRAFGEVLHLERDGSGDWLADVEALGVPLSAARIGG